MSVLTDALKTFQFIIFSSHGTNYAFMKLLAWRLIMKKAFTLIEILIVVTIIGLIAAIGIPAFRNSQLNANNEMKDINIAAVNAAKDQWAIINNKATGTAVVWTNISAYIGNSITNLAGLTISGTTITIGNVGTSASY